MSAKELQLFIGWNMTDLRQWKTIYKRYDVNAGILNANVFTELYSSSETSAFRIMSIISANCVGLYDVTWAALPGVSAIFEMCLLTTKLLLSYLSSWTYA